MQFFCAESRMERLRRRAVQNGDFVDVTREARDIGFNESVCISRCLWECLVQPYPFSSQNDYVSLRHLLWALHSHLQITKCAASSVSFLVPSRLPGWCRAAVTLKVAVFSPLRQPRAIMVHLHSSRPQNQHSYLLLPATLLVRLAETLHNFTSVARTSEKASIRAMQATLDQLIASNPFHREITAHLANIALDPPNGVPVDNYRSALLAELDELLAIVDRCGKGNAKDIIELLRAQFRALISPLTHFSRILEDFLRFTQSGANPRAPFQGQVFSLLLQLYADTSARLERLETQVPPEALSVVHFQLRLLAESLGASGSPFLAQIDNSFKSLSKGQLPRPTHGPLHECRADVVWH